MEGGSIEEIKASFEADMLRSRASGGSEGTPGRRLYGPGKLIQFRGMAESGWDVYNCSVPFLYKGKQYIYGRVEKRNEWATSHTRLFKLVSTKDRDKAGGGECQDDDVAIRASGTSNNNNSVSKDGEDAASCRSERASKAGEPQLSSVEAKEDQAGEGEEGATADDVDGGAGRDGAMDDNNEGGDGADNEEGEGGDGGDAVYEAVPRMFWELEDPFVQKIHGECIVGGTHVRKDAGAVVTYFGYFYRGHNPFELKYFTTGPDFMKDIRTVQLKDGRVGVFSRRRTPQEIYVGFTIVPTINELTVDSIDSAVELEGVFMSKTHWGGVNQAYLLTSGKVGCIAHYSYNREGPLAEGRAVAVYLNYAFVLDPETRVVSHQKLIGTRACFPDYPCKKPHLIDCAFSSGIVMRKDGKCDLYSGLGDTCQGCITIDYPFEENGAIVGDIKFVV